MTRWKADYQGKQVRLAMAAVARWRTLATVRSPLVQYSTAVTVGILLGLYLLIVIQRNPRWAPFLTLAAFAPFVAIIFGDVRRFLLVVMLLELPLLLDMAVLYDERAVVLFAIGGLSISISGLCLVGLYALWFLELLAQNTAFPRSLRTGLPLLAYLAVVVLSILYAQNIRLAVFEIFMLLQSFLLFVYIVKFVRSRQDLLLVVTLLLIGLTYESLVMIGLRVLGHNVSFAGVTAGIDDSGRVFGTIGSPNTAASYLTLILPLALGVLLTPLSRRHKWLAAAALGLGTVALVLTSSRGGWCALFVSVTLFCLLALFRGWLPPRVLLIITAVFVLTLLFFREPISARLLGDDHGATEARSTMANQALRVIKEHPVLGVGANNYSAWLDRYTEPERDIDMYRLHTVHNKYLLVLAETGIFGLVTFVGFLFAIIHRGWQGWQLHDRLLSPLALSLTVAIVGQMVHMFVDIFHSRAQVQTLWIVAALVIATGNMDAVDG
jgi:O-antigen ligase